MSRFFPPVRGVLLAALFIVPAANAFAQRKSPDAPPGGPAKNNPRILELFKPIVAKVSESTVDILDGDKSVALGTVVAEAFILTKDSELRGEKIIVRAKDGKEYPAKKISSNETWDLALLTIEAKGLKPVKWEDSKLAPVGHWIATAAPAEKPIAIGVVSVASRAMPPGPKVALPKNNNDRGYLGIQMEDSESGAGVKIVVVTPKSPAEKAGLKENDVIIAVNGKETLDRDTLGATIGRNKPGDIVTVRFRRGDTEDEVKATLDKRPAGLGMDRGDFQNSMGTDRSERRTGFPNALQHDTDLKASQCGGPLVDLDGRVIGINIARGGRTDTYAIPSEILRPLINEMMAVKGPVPDALKALTDRVKAAEAVLKDAETEKLNAEKRFNEAKSALDKLLEEQKKLKK
jgi:serine protease Do